jgi:hypothetical protein
MIRARHQVLDFIEAGSGHGRVRDRPRGGWPDTADGLDHLESGHHLLRPIIRHRRGKVPHDVIVVPSDVAALLVSPGVVPTR